MKQFSFDQLVENWPSPIVARSEVKEFSGGLLHPRTMANIDSLGLGPDKMTIGRRVFYETLQLVEWMKVKYTINHSEDECEEGRNG